MLQKTVAQVGQPFPLAPVSLNLKEMGVASLLAIFQLNPVLSTLFRLYTIWVSYVCCQNSKKKCYTQGGVLLQSFINNYEVWIQNLELVLFFSKIGSVIGSRNPIGTQEHCKLVIHIMWLVFVWLYYSQFNSVPMCNQSGVQASTKLVLSSNSMLVGVTNHIYVHRCVTI